MSIKISSAGKDRDGLWKTITGIAMILVVLISITAVNAQTYTPLRYWSFDNPTNAMKDSTGNYNMDPTYYGSPYTINTNAANVGVGRYLTLDPNSGLIKMGVFSVDTAFTIEFLFRPGYQFNTSNFFARLDGAMKVSMGYSYINFNTKTNNYSGGTTTDDLRVELNQTGRRSYSYFMDGNWHHIVMKYNSKTGLKQIFIDGECPDGYSKTVASGYFTNNTSVNRDLILNTNVSYVKYFGDYDEMALYTYSLPDKQIYKHYQDYLQKKHYTYAAYTGTVPANSPVTAGMDVNEFAPGHPSVSISAVDQMAQFPTPRYKPGNTLLKNFNWMDPRYMGGLSQTGVSTTQAVINSASIQTELVKNFNYYLSLGAGNSQFDTAWIGIANRNPSYKLSLITFRAQPNSQLLNQAKPNDHYLQNASGQYLNAAGSVTSSKIWRPTAPPSSYTADGNVILTGLNDLFTRLNRGLDMINENGEIFPYPKEAAMVQDPVVTAAKNASGLDWQTFLSKKFMENETQAFRNVFMSHSRLTNTKFTEFSIDGYPPLYGFKYSEARKVNSLINNQYYSTPSFYTRHAYNWRTWTSAWHGWQWIVESRVHELALGDRLFSPFVSAGWDAVEENNIRPAQWMGLMKALGMAGAEFYYAGFFSIGAPWPDSKNWIWQAAVPSYAQAITSRYEDYLRNGELMDGDVANSYISPTAPGYSFWTGDLRKLVVVRKHNAGNKYAITGTLQPNSSMVGNAENESVAKIKLNGQMISFKVRRQGSTYIYDNTNTAAPVFYQLDGWHEQTHPSRWTKDFIIEGELYDNSNTQVAIKTAVPAGTAAGDFTNATSYVAWPDNATTPQAVEYNFSPRTSANSTLYVWVRARSRGGVSTSMNIQFDNNATKTIGCVTDTAWKWYRYDACSQLAISASGLTIQNHIFRITPGNAKLEIDRIQLTTNSNLGLSTALPSCGSATATITANGSTTFCTGGSVVLTASSGSSYLWSPGGQTTQSITVTTAGSYSVSVGAGTGCAAVSNPVVVTVNSGTTATITTGGATTFCQGGSVTLTASAGTAYLWTPGNQTTQSIAVSTGGTYNVKVTYTGGCTSTSANTIVTVNSIPTATITAGGSTTFCQGGSVTLTSSSGSAYLWSPGNQTTQSVSVTAGGTYSVRVTNSSGCTKVSSNTVVTVNSLPTATITASGPLNLATGGSVTLTASSGSSYLWLPGNQITQSITVSTAGSYSVRVTNSNGCSKTSAASVVTVGTPGTASITTSGHTSFCQGGSVTLTASTGTSYLWSNGATTKSITASTSGTYSVTVYNGTTPSVAPGVSVVVYPLPTATITPNGPTSICMGNIVNLVASPNVFYSWTPGGQTNQTLYVSSSGTYNVTVTDINGCTKTASAVPVTVSSCTSCDPPYGLVTVSYTATTAKFAWTNPNSGQTNFQVKFQNQSTGYTYVTGTMPATSTQTTISVSPGITYRWWVRSHCGSTISSWAGYLAFVTPLVRVQNPGDENSVEYAEAYELYDESSDPSMEIQMNVNEVQLFPNPASTEANVSFYLEADEKIAVTLMELNGKIMSRQSIAASEGFNIHNIDISMLPKGVYMVQLTGNANTVTKRLAIQ